MSAWERHARCLTVGVDAFFPTSRGVDATADMKAAKAVCDWCPVEAQCLELAIEREGDRPTVERAGVWGGKTPRQRSAINKQRQQQQAA